MRRFVLGLIFAMLVVAAIALLKSNAEGDHPLLVQSASPTQGDEASSNRLFVPCPLTPRNLPLREERTA